MIYPFVVIECKWNKNIDGCSVIYIETICNKLSKTDESSCKALIDQGQPCCMAGKDKNFGYLCLNTSYDGRKQCKYNCTTIEPIFKTSQIFLEINILESVFAINLINKI